MTAQRVTTMTFFVLLASRPVGANHSRASLPNVGGITEMLKIMAVCDTHKVGIGPHCTGDIQVSSSTDAGTTFTVTLPRES